MVSKVISAMLYASQARLVDVEADVSTGLPAMEMTGNLSNSVRDGKERIRVAIKKSGYPFPLGRVTINLAPASLKKEGTGFDLAVAMAVLVQMEIIRQEKIDNHLIVGEVGLDGRVIGVRGILPMVMEAKRNGLVNCIVPSENYKEACIIQDINIIAAESIKQLVGILNGNAESFSDGINNGDADKEGNLQEAVGEKNHNINRKLQVYEQEDKGFEKYIMKKPDFLDVYGQEYAKRAILVATAGMHNILLLGPPGAGKTMLVSRIPTIMPPLSADEWLRLVCIYSVAGKVDEQINEAGERLRPFRAPHHSITNAALVGGGRIVEPGEISLASKGVLFLDELTKYNPQVIELLREPMESGKITINRVSGVYEFDADFMLASALNPCPCGFYPDRNKCSCTQIQIRNHYGKISKPILDRIDISINLSRLEFEELENNKRVNNSVYSSKNMKEIIERVWEIQTERLGKNKFNSRMTTGQINDFCSLDEESTMIMKKAYDSFGMSARAYHKTLKVARTIADIEGKEKIETSHILESLGYRVKENIV